MGTQETDVQIAQSLKLLTMGLEAQYFNEHAATEREESRPPVEPWPVEQWRQIAVQGIESDKLAKESYDNLLRAGVRSPEALQIFVGMAATAPKSAGRVDSLSGSGKTIKTLAYFPRRLKAAASEIEKLNKHSLLRPDVWVSSGGFSELEERIFGRWFLRMPVLLRRYADFLDAQSRRVKRFGASGRWSPQTFALSALIGYVRQETKRPMFEDLGNVLDATARVAYGEKSQTFLVASLKMLDSRKRKKTKTVPTYLPSNPPG